MLRVREVPARALARGGEGPAAGSGEVKTVRRGSTGRLMALIALGAALGSGGVVLTASMVQAEGDAGVREFIAQEAQRRTEQARLRNAAYTSTRYAPQANAYAPANQGWRLPLMQVLPDGRLAQPIDLNPFRKQDRKLADRRRKAAGTAAAMLDPVTGVADRTQTFCVRLCDGFHAPIGYLRSPGDLKAHEALCTAMNPGVPVKVFRLAAGAAGIAEAVAADGKRYAALPMAFSHEKAADPACRPAIVQAGERRISLLRDITLRPGDSVVLDGKVSTFAGSASWPYSRRDFRDFRTASELSKAQRRQIDQQVGISRQEAQARSLRRQMRVREAYLRDDSTASDAVLRGTVDPATRTSVRLIPLTLPAR
ncbi:DUF2865 domain-containing protein [Bosea sp. (in: a-proteobacteria)]|uniref:DUF2865 domain-containing protein n=1 Tax=Bosea sp. (in: a-proteobacteria) TaxID=1871050 RepID=UPI002631CDB8|nr:DUF2865 domain-containing protein [Bosea sp. (in: a-proteobacteria)]MCO5093417.1 DUF2865 domain-containing protein [Bosea sp. (in: a-proteobacteria)]